MVISDTSKRDFCETGRPIWSLLLLSCSKELLTGNFWPEEFFKIVQKVRLH